MTIAILILAHVLLLNDVASTLKEGQSGIVVSSALNVLLAWQVNQTWGIVYLVLLTILSVLAVIIIYTKNN